jgi:hypothetical protein
VTAAKTREPGRIRMWPVVLGVVLAGLICAVTPLNNIYNRATPLGGGHFPLAPFFIFFVLAVVVSVIARLLRSRPLLSGPELLIIWIQMVIGSGIAYTGLARTFLINLTAPVHFATASNQWRETFDPLLPLSLMPRHPETIALLYDGLPGGRAMNWVEVLAAIPWAGWLPPLMNWAIFVFASYLAMLMLITLFSRQWIVNERLNLPLLKVPQLISTSVDQNWIGELLFNRFLLVGLAVPVVLHTFNGLSLYYPSIPAIPTLILAGKYFPKEGLLSGFYKLKLYFYPAFIGFAYLTSRQISFSFWFFFMAGSLLFGILAMLGYTIPAAQLGITFGPTLTRPEETQMIGAFAIFFLFLVWLARHHLLDVTKQALFISRGSSDTRFNSTVMVFWGFWGACLLLTLWFVRHGVSGPAAILLVGGFLVISLVATRIICQGGIAYFTLTIAPLDGLIALFGAKFFAAAGGLIGAISQKALFLDMRESLMPSLLHAKKIHQGRTPPALLTGGLVATLFVSVICSMTAMMALAYRFGMRELDLEWANRTTLNVYENVYRLLVNPVNPGEWVYTFILVGAVVMLILVFCYHRLPWWPLHPIGYLTTYSSAMRILWVSFFIGWLCNVLCMKYGGVNLFKKMQFFFIGLIIGDLLMGGIWAIIGQFTYTSYMVLPD